jgi:hypothetical protein
LEVASVEAFLPAEEDSVHVETVDEGGLDVLVEVAGAVAFKVAAGELSLNCGETEHSDSGEHECGFLEHICS